MASNDAKAAVFVKSTPYEGTRIRGPDFNLPHELEDLLKSYETIGFQANGLARAMELVNKMVSALHPFRSSVRAARSSKTFAAGSLP